MYVSISYIDIYLRKSFKTVVVVVVDVVFKKDISPYNVC